MTVGNIRWFGYADCYFWNASKGKYVEDGYISQRYIPIPALELSPPFDTEK